MNDLALGLDIGSTTVKAVVVHPDTREILWSRYEKHEARQTARALELLEAAEAAFPGASFRLFATGTGAGPVAEPLGGKIVQEVNALSFAVERLHPEVRSVVELGGQDAKVLIFLESENGDRWPFVSMNDRCASGTGATIDKCLIKVGMTTESLRRLVFDDRRLHRVAAKCGVFAETDIVGLLKSGVPAPEIMNSLGDAIVQQNLSVLARGKVLRPPVLLLGGPHAMFPFLAEAWRKRLPATWAAQTEVCSTQPECGAEAPHVGQASPPAPGGAGEDARATPGIEVPPHAAFYPALGAVLYGLEDAEAASVWRGLEPLRAHLRESRGPRVSQAAGPALVSGPGELDRFLREYAPPPFRPPRLSPGETLPVIIGMDGGSTSSKAVLLDERGEVVQKAYRISKGNPIQDAKELLAELKAWADDQGASLEVLGFGATGYAADVLEETLKADVNIVETVAHKIGAMACFPDVDVICDVGGQDIKVIFLRDGDILGFRLNNQCSAGNGMLLQMMAEQFGVGMDRFADVAFEARTAPLFSYGCGVFLDADRVSFQREGFTAPEMLAGLAQVLPKNIWQYIVQEPRLAGFGTRFLLQGGTQRNLAAVKAQVDYIRERVPEAEVRIHPHCGEAGALGAALETLREVRRRGASTFVGLDEAIGLEWKARNDPSTVCRFCANECKRTFVDARTPDGRSSRYISGFACENGTVERKEDLQALARRRAEEKKRHPNLLAEEAALAFRRFCAPAPMPADGEPVREVVKKRNLLFRRTRREVRRGFRRSPAASWEARRSIRIGMPRVLNMYSTGPFWRAYFEALGVPSGNLVWSSPTSEERWREGARYGSIDPCFPSKVVQAHIHELLTRKAPLRYLYFPCITHVPTWVSGTMDSVCCTVAAGAPNVIKAAFTKEADLFAAGGTEYVDGAVTLTEPNLLRRVLFETWAPRLGVTEDESDFATGQGFRALEEFGRRMEERGRQVLDDVEARGGIAILVLGRPYHADPGLNHGIPDEFQALGYPILSIRSLPKDPAWLHRVFGNEDPLGIRDVWPEDYSANSAQKVWAAKVAARHPRLAVLDLCSFKCGHDAPTHSLIDRIIAAGRKPYAAFHDIDANRPAGSIKLRVRTFAVSLRRREEELGLRPVSRGEPERALTARESAHEGIQALVGNRPS